MPRISLEEAQAKLPQLIDQLAPGEELFITRDNKMVAKLVGADAVEGPRQPGNCRGMLTIASDDDQHLRDWEEYLP